MKRERPSKEELDRLYWEKEWSTRKIAKRYGVNSKTVSYWLKIDKIHSRTISEGVTLMHGRIKPAKRELNNLHNNRNMSVYKIAKKYRVVPTTIRKWMDEYGIKRNRNHNKTGAWKDLNFVLERALQIMGDEDWQDLPGSTVLVKRGYINLATNILRYHGGFPAFRGRLNEYLGREPEETQLENLLEQYAGGENE